MLAEFVRDLEAFLGEEGGLGWRFVWMSWGMRPAGWEGDCRLRGGGGGAEVEEVFGLVVVSHCGGVCLVVRTERGKDSKEGGFGKAQEVRKMKGERGKERNVLDFSGS